MFVIKHIENIWTFQKNKGEQQPINFLIYVECNVLLTDGFLFY